MKQRRVAIAWVEMWLAALCACCLLMPQTARAQDEKQVNAYFGNEIIALKSSATTVGGFLNELSIQLPPDMVIDPPMDAALKDQMNVFISELYVSRGTVEHDIPVVVDLTEQWHFGQEMVRLADPGRTGLARTTVTVFHRDGIEVGRRQREEVIIPMRPRRVICYRPLSSEDGPSIDDILTYRMPPAPDLPAPPRYREMHIVESTAYEPGPQSCGRFASGFTSCGYEAGYGVVAVDPQLIPLHTRLFIEGYGYAVAGDVGSAIKGNRVDVGMMTVDECMDWGRREVRVYVLY